MRFCSAGIMQGFAFCPVGAEASPQFSHQNAQVLAHVIRALRRASCQISFHQFLKLQTVRNWELGHAAHVDIIVGNLVVIEVSSITSRLRVALPGSSCSSIENSKGKLPAATSRPC